MNDKDQMGEIRSALNHPNKIIPRQTNPAYLKYIVDSLTRKPTDQTFQLRINPVVEQQSGSLKRISSAGHIRSVVALDFAHFKETLLRFDDHRDFHHYTYNLCLRRAPWLNLGGIDPKDITDLVFVESAESYRSLFNRHYSSDWVRDEVWNRVDDGYDQAQQPFDSLTQYVNFFWKVVDRVHDLVEKYGKDLVGLIESGSMDQDDINSIYDDLALLLTSDPAYIRFSKFNKNLQLVLDDLDSNRKLGFDYYLTYGVKYAFGSYDEKQARIDQWRKQFIDIFISLYTLYGVTRLKLRQSQACDLIDSFFVLEPGASMIFQIRDLWPDRYIRMSYDIDDDEYDRFGFGEQSYTPWSDFESSLPETESLYSNVLIRLFDMLKSN